ncbi:VENN motif pre-toxin domain-containing protein [Acinetobacter sp. I-MWF]|nr:EndoU domain-containing protein [Acinetobacter sp. I-MWF]MCT9978149.1 VENN motif pre-toxin domain-containing protein [Acinetobacter sp. I-MWF]
MAVTGALGGQTDLQVAANALAPYAANIIGKELGHGEDKNKAAQLAAHAILGAALAYVNGGNPAAGGSAAVASEAAADYLTNQYKDKKEYQDVNGEFQPNLLPEDVKTQIRDLTAAIGAVVGGTVGDSAFNAQLAGVVGQNAVENNKTSYWQDIKHLGCWSDECVVAYKQMDAAQDAAFRKGQDQALLKFANDIKNLPNVPKEVYEAVKNDLKGTAKAIYEGIKDIPAEIWDTTKTITTVNMLGNTPADFEALGNAEMTTTINLLSAAISAGAVTVVKKGGTITIEAVKNIKNSYILAKTPEGISFQIKQPTHLATVDGFTQKSGVSGGHNADAFYKEAKDKGVQILNEKPTNVDGITQIEYKIPTKDAAGNFTGNYKGNGAKPFEKTVYDPKIFTDKKILELGQKAAANGYKQAIAKGVQAYDASAGGVTFRIYIDPKTKGISNFHPK